MKFYNYLNEINNSWLRSESDIIDIVLSDEDENEIKKVELNVEYEVFKGGPDISDNIKIRKTFEFLGKKYKKDQEFPINELFEYLHPGEMNLPYKLEKIILDGENLSNRQKEETFKKIISYIIINEM